MSDVLASPIQFIKGVGPKLAKTLSKKGIATVEDALYFIPRTYEDRRHLTPMNLLKGGEATVLGKVVAQREIRQGRRSRFEATLSDGAGRVVLTWFHAYPSLKEEFSEGNTFVVFGEVRLFNGIPQIAHPEYEKITEFVEGKPKASFNFGRIVPVYSETEGLHQKILRKMMGEVLKVSLSHLNEPLPESLRERLHLPTLRKSFVSIHFPDSLPPEGGMSDAVQRIVFEEFFVLQLGLALKKRQIQRETAPVIRDESQVIERFCEKLPFALTQDQRLALDHILTDLGSSHRMARLVQGDVGSGKTVVALAAAAVAASKGFQTAIMAPTELLAQQHLRTAQTLLEPLGLEAILISHSTSQKKKIREKVATTNASVVVGTHALFQEAIEFKNLGLVIVDEQHRFGVEQRSELLRKGKDVHPHLLMMTATPIPRTLALTLYGDLDLTLIREKPKGRQKIVTRILRDKERPRLYHRMREAVLRGEQVYVIYPLIEASEKLELKSATEMYERLSREVFPDLSLVLLHGRMKAEEKERILTEFKEKKHQILISTTVIEVGIDVPNATLMVIEHPERLGLSQLHQLRGRVGRGEKASECILVADSYVSPRLRVMEQSEDGFVIAEEDLKIRGPGEFLGTRQSGLPGFRVGHILRDALLLQRAREEAMRLLEGDPELKLDENASIRAMVESRWKEKIERLRGG